MLVRTEVRVGLPSGMEAALLPLGESIQAGIRACVEARRSDEPKRLMTAFLDRRKK